MMNKNYIAVGGIFAALGILLGALGAHWLRSNISLIDLQTYETGVRYQIYHALAIILLGLLYSTLSKRLITLAFHAFWTGTLLFSGSIYLLATAGISGLQVSWIGPLTPIGGVLFILGWVGVVFAAISSFKDD